MLKISLKDQEHRLGGRKYLCQSTSVHSSERRIVWWSLGICGQDVNFGLSIFLGSAFAGKDCMSELQHVSEGKYSWKDTVLVFEVNEKLLVGWGPGG